MPFFVFHTRDFPGPYRSRASKIIYDVIPNQPFKVENESDLEFFRAQPQRLREVDSNEAERYFELKQKQHTKTPREDLETYLIGLGIAPEAKSKLIKRYESIGSFKNLVTEQELIALPTIGKVIAKRLIEKIKKP